MASNSPTRRLDNLLRTLANSVGSVPTDSAIGDVYARALGLDRNDLLTLHTHYLKTLRLIESARREVVSAYTDPAKDPESQQATIKVALGPLEPIRSTFLGNSIHSKAPILKQFPPAELYQVLNTIDRFAKGPSLADDAVEQAITLVGRANQVIGSAGLDPRFVALFHQRTALVLEALKQFDQYGPDDAVEAVGIVLADVYVYQQLVPVGDREKIRPAIELIANILTIIQVSWPVASPLLLGLLAKLLGP